MKKEIKVINDCRDMFPQEIVESIMDSRGIIDVDRFLNPTVNDLFPLDSLYRIDEAADIIIDALKNNKKILIHYDVDVDGICSGTIAKRYFDSLGIKTEWSINNGKEHGTTYNLLEKVEKDYIDIVIIVDSIDDDVENYKKLKEMGVKTIILDHHHVKETVPYDDYAVLVSSSRKYDNPYLSGAGVVFKFVLYLDSLLGTVYAERFYDLCATGLIGDMMNVSEESMENRYLIKKGLENLNNLALTKMKGSYPFTSTTVAFSVAPLVNASMRLQKNEEAVLAFLSDDNKEVLKHIRELKKCKESQNLLIDDMMPDLIDQCESQLDNKVIVVVIDENLSLTGYIANKLMAIYNKPVFVLHENYGGYSGSARAVGVEDFRSLCEDTGLCEVGGHPNSFGVINIPYNYFDEFREQIENKLKNIEFKTNIKVDVLIDLNDLNENLIEEINKIDYISGEGFKPIKFEIDIDSYEVGNMSQGKHLVLKPSSNVMFIKWNLSNDKWEDIEDAELCESEISCIGTLQKGFVARKYVLQMIIDDYIIN